MINSVVTLSIAIYLVSVATANAQPTKQHCVNKQEFQDAVPISDDLARRLLNLSERPSVSEETRQTMQSAATLLRLDSRLLALSSWSCKGHTNNETPKAKITGYAQAPTPWWQALLFPTAQPPKADTGKNRR